MRYEVTRHAAKRYAQRVRRGTGLCRELGERVAAAPLVERPWWAQSRCEEAGASYALLDEDTVAVVVERVVVTVLTRESCAEAVEGMCRRLGWVREAA